MCGERPRDVQRLAHVDVAEPGDHPLIEQRGFQRRLLAAAGARASAAPSNSADNGSGPSRLSAGCVARLAAGTQIHEAEAPRIVEEHRRLRRHVEDHMVVPAGVVAVRRRRVGSTRNDPDIPRCISSVSPDDSSASRYFARRLSRVIVHPSRRARKRRGKRVRRSERWRVTRSNRAPSNAGSSSRRVVSTSGSSGRG